MSRIFGIAFALLAAGCAQIVSVNPARPQVAVQGSASAREISRAATLAKNAPLTGIAEYLAWARAASEDLRRNPEDHTARKRYNFAVARCVEIIQRENLNPWDQRLNLPGQFTLTGQTRLDRGLHPRDFRLIPADTVAVGGTYFKTRAQSGGLGAPLIAMSRGEVADRPDPLLPERLYESLTAVIRFSGGDAQLELIHPFRAEQVTLDGRTYPVAADFSSHLAMALARERPQKLSLIRLLRPDRYRDTATLTRLQPYDPARIPVIFVHGLQDTPASWVPMIRALMSDPAIRKRYQFWVFSYPSGYPIPYSAALLRKQLDTAATTFPGHQRIILVGHSMGGLISRLMVTDPGDRFWRAAFGTAPGKTRATGPSPRLAEQSLLFEPRPDVQRVVFLATPHRGSELAGNWIGRLASKIVKMPQFLNEARDVVQAVVTGDRAAATHRAAATASCRTPVPTSQAPNPRPSSPPITASNSIRRASKKPTGS